MGQNGLKLDLLNISIHFVYSLPNTPLSKLISLFVNSLCQTPLYNAFLFYIATVLIHFTGEWWNANPIDVENAALASGGAPADADAYTFNGWPGDLCNSCVSNSKYIST